MSFKLKYTKDGNLFERDVTPLGQLSVVTTRNNHRYTEEMGGTMTFAGEDFDFIMSAGACTEIFIECGFKKEWNGVFSHTDCTTINRSKKKLEVQPRPDDEYRKIEPWMRLEMNIIPPYKEIESRVPIYTLNQYELEKKTIRITEAYTGPGFENWVGYSVNDWVGNDGVIATSPYGPYDSINQIHNSFIYHVYNPKGLGTLDLGITPPAGMNFTRLFPLQRLGWIDALGLELMNAAREGVMTRNTAGVSFTRRYWRESQFTLTEIINFYDEDYNWEYCDVVYYREKFGNDPKNPPPSGLYWDSDFKNSSSPELPLGVIDTVVTGRWIWNAAEKRWIRRYLGLNQWGTDLMITPINTLNDQTGNGFDYSPLIEGRENDKKVLKQCLFRNKYAQDTLGSDWHKLFYGATVYSRHFHKPELLLHKLLAFVKDKGAPTLLDTTSISSQFWQLSNNPYTGTSNIWQEVLIGQNSDIKRPLSSEQATKEMHSFESFLDMICSLSNSAWAIINGELVIEHISYFEKGLTYSVVIPSESILNPFSINNIAKNKGFMALTDIYSYDKPNMHKFEIFKTDGGQEPLNNNSKIEYERGCINNIPNENITETTIPTTTDYDFTRSDGRDEGLTFISTYMANVYPHGNINHFLPTQDQYGRFIYNSDFTLEEIIREYHNWGRNDTSAKLNEKEWDNLRTFNNIIQPLGIPYDQENPEKADNPYSIIVTNLGYGIIRRVEYQSRKGWMVYELGLNSIEAVEPPEVSADWHIHTQTAFDSATWNVIHQMNTKFIMRPVVFDLSGNEIGYDEFRVVNSNNVYVRFSVPVKGVLHLIALNVDESKLYTYDGNSDEWIINHGLDISASQMALSAIFDNNGIEIRPNRISFPTNNQIIIKFTRPVSGSVAIADISDYSMVVQEEDISGVDQASFSYDIERVYGKPLVLYAGEEIIYNSQSLQEALRIVGFSVDVIAKVVVMEKIKT